MCDKAGGCDDGVSCSQECLEGQGEMETGPGNGGAGGLGSGSGEKSICPRNAGALFFVSSFPPLGQTLDADNYPVCLISSYKSLMPKLYVVQ